MNQSKSMRHLHSDYTSSTNASSKINSASKVNSDTILKEPGLMTGRGKPAAPLFKTNSSPSQKPQMHNRAARTAAMLKRGHKVCPLNHN